MALRSPVDLSSNHHTRSTTRAQSRFDHASDSFIDRRWMSSPVPRERPNSANDPRSRPDRQCSLWRRCRAADDLVDRAECGDRCREATGGDRAQRGLAKVVGADAIGESLANPEQPDLARAQARQPPLPRSRAPRRPDRCARTSSRGSGRAEGQRQVARRHAGRREERPDLGQIYATVASGTRTHQRVHDGSEAMLDVGQPLRL